MSEEKLTLHKFRMTRAKSEELTGIGRELRKEFKEGNTKGYTKERVADSCNDLVPIAKGLFGDDTEIIIEDISSLPTETGHSIEILISNSDTGKVIGFGIENGTTKKVTYSFFTEKLITK